jgi:hypothetical protein
MDNMNYDLVKNICLPIIGACIGGLLILILLASDLNWAKELKDLNSKIDKIVIFLDLNAEDEVAE